MPRMAAPLALRAVAVFPDQLAGLAVDRLHDVAGVVEIDDAVVHERRGLVGAAFVHRPDPLQAQILDVVGGDLVERAVVRGVVVAPDHQPVAGIGIAQHRVGDRDVVLHFAGDGDAGGRRRRPVPRPAGGLLPPAGGAPVPAARRRDGRAPGPVATELIATSVVARQRLIAGRRAVRLQDERGDVDVFLLAERARAASAASSAA